MYELQHMNTSEWKRISLHVAHQLIHEAAKADSSVWEMLDEGLTIEVAGGFIRRNTGATTGPGAYR